MKKLYSLLAIVFFFNCANGQSIDSTNDNNGFDSSKKLKNIEENELIFQLNQLEEDGYSSTLPIEEDSKLFEKEILEFDEISNLELNSSSKNLESTIDDQTLQKGTKQLLNTGVPPSQNDNTTSHTFKKGLNQEQIRKIQYVKKLYEKGQFFLLSRSVLESNEYESLYYQALGNYNILRKSKDYQGKTLSINLQKKKKALIKKAKDSLYNVGINSPDLKLKERGIFWYGVLTIIYPYNNRDEEELTSTFLYIEKRMKNSNVYNDALIYLTMIYKKMGKLKKAKEYYQKALKTSADDLVYNYKTDTMMPANNLLELFRYLK